jgi:hypothetical protein
MAPSFLGIVLIEAVGQVIAHLFSLPFSLSGFLALRRRAVLLIRIAGPDNE